MNCRVCGSPLPEGALFCGECGSAVNATPVTRAAAADTRTSDTTIIERMPRPATAGPAIVSREILFDMPRPEGGTAAGGTAAGGAAAVGAAAAASDATPDTVLRDPAQRDAAGRHVLAGIPGQEPPRARVEEAVTHPPEDAAGAVGRDGRATVPDAVERVAGVGDTAAATEAAPFVLSFSTGEVARVTGGGLLGRRPVAQPGESVPQVVQISDPGRSVSKTHLEFGLEAGELWICDRYSGNGTVVYPPGARPRRCEPGRRYRVARGARVEIGDQYFDVS